MKLLKGFKCEIDGVAFSDFTYHILVIYMFYITWLAIAIIIIFIKLYQFNALVNTKEQDHYIDLLFLRHHGSIF